MAPAKINLCLLVGPRRKDGYHPVCSLMERVSLFDRISVIPGGGGLRLSGMDMPASENIVSRAVEALAQRTGASLGARIRIEKGIPMAAGLGGGSSDAAAVLQALNDLAAPGLSREALMGVAAAVGADAPFFLTEGPQLAEGSGEQLRSVEPLPSFHLVLVAPDTGLSTAEIYGLYDEVAGVTRSGFERRVDGLRRLLAGGDLELPGLARLLVNDLEPVAMELVPEIGEIKHGLLELGAAGALMSGSGSSVFGLFATAAEARRAVASLKRRFPRCWALRPLRR